MVTKDFENTRTAILITNDVTHEGRFQKEHCCAIDTSLEISQDYTDFVKIGRFSINISPTSLTSNFRLL